MFRRKRHISKQVMFALIMDTTKHCWDIPEITLWANFSEALEVAVSAVIETIDEDIAWSEFEFSENKAAFLPDCFEIMPISLSTPECITWFGKKRKEKTNNE